MLPLISFQSLRQGLHMQVTQTALSFNLIQVHRYSVWIEEFLILNNIKYFMHVV